MFKIKQFTRLKIFLKHRIFKYTLHLAPVENMPWKSAMEVVILVFIFISDKIPLNCCKHCLQFRVKTTKILLLSNKQLFFRMKFPLG